MKTILKTFSLALLLMLCGKAQAIPAYNILQKQRQPDGTMLSFRLMGDEHLHWFVTADGYLVDRDADGAMYYVQTDSQGNRQRSSVLAHDNGMRSAEEEMLLQREGPADMTLEAQKTRRQRAAERRIQGATFPTKGNLRGVVLLVEFNDNAFDESHDQTLFQRMATEEGFSHEGATGSIRDYFVAQSMGEFTPTFDVIGPIKLSKNMSYYGQNNSQGEDANGAQMVKEACEKAHNDFGVDFSNYDYNNDGVVDWVYVIYAGYAESYGASANTIWPHASNIEQQYVYLTLDGKKIQRYACSSEMKYTSGNTLEGIGTFCHEFGHVLGLPDMYNTYTASLIQLGSWDIMDQGSYNNDSHTPPAYSAFERSFMGWLEFTDIDTPAERLTLDELTENNVAYRITTSNENEFFTLENRQQKGWDAYQPGRGLMIIHVYFEQSAWDGNFFNVGTPRYDLIEADGTQGSNYSTDLYPIAGNNMFTDYSTPNSLMRDGTPTEKGVTNIEVNDGIVSFTFMKDRLRRPVLTAATDITSTSFVANWQPVDEAQSYRLALTEVLPDDANPVILDEDFSLMTAGEYPKSDYIDLGNNVSDYMHAAGWFGSQLYDSGGYLRIGGYGQSGTLNSPLLDLTVADGVATLAFHAVAYPGKSVSYKVSLVDVNSSAVLESHDLKATKTEEEQRLVFTKGNSRCRLVFTTSNERLFLDDLRLVKGEVDAADVWNVGPRKWTVDSIADTHCLVEGLVPERTYIYKVQALDPQELRSSLYSTEARVTTREASGIATTDRQGTRKAVATAYYDLSGRPATDSRRGVLIRKTTFADGTTSTEKLVR